MTEQDTKNLDIVRDIVTKAMGYDKDSIDYFVKELYDPFIDDEFKKLIGPDRRARWAIDTSLIDKEKLKQSVYAIFSNHFHTFICSNCAKNSGAKVITADNVMENIITIDKNDIKIKKYISDFYVKNKTRWDNDSAYGGKIIPHNKDEIDKYIIKVFEKIGIIKQPKENKKMELVLSCNFADYMMCSAKENWSSCYSIESGEYWFGVPGLIGDKDRAVLYVTNGEKKEFLGIKVDRMINRSWLFISKDNKKMISGFYPSGQGLYSDESIRKITNDNSYVKFSDGFLKGKNKIHFLYFEKIGLACTTSNDACGIESIDADGLGTWRLGGGQSVTWIDKETKKTIYYGGYGHGASQKLDSLLKAGITYGSFLNPLKRCSGCGSTSIYEDIGKEHWCNTCYNKLFFSCYTCSGEHKLETMKVVAGRKYCEKHAPTPFVCPICGKEKIGGSTINEVKICNDCLIKLPTCRKCHAQKTPQNMVIVHDVEQHKRKHRCKVCAEAEWRDFKYCPSCHELWPEDHLIYEGGCKNCHDKKAKE